MSRPESFILTTDFATLKNDDEGGGSVTMPSALVLTAGQLYTQTQDIQVGTINAPSRVQIASSKESNVFYAGSVYVVDRTGQISGPTNVPYNIIAYSTRISPEVVRIIAAITNPYGENMTTASGSETFTFDIGTSLSPFN